MGHVRNFGVGLFITVFALAGCGGGSSQLDPDAQAVYNTLKKGEEDLKKYGSSLSVCTDTIDLGASQTANELPKSFPDLSKIGRDDLVAGSQRFIQDCQAGVFD
jgi:hypothetical protein